jgi:hypothetical protein
LHPQQQQQQQVIENSSNNINIAETTTSNNNIELKYTRIPLKSIGIIQSVANHDPDVDAIYRLTQPLPFDFPTTVLNGRGNNNHFVLVPKKSYAPYNAQATMHFYSSFWSLLLPVTVHGRVSDIWRGYFAQRVGNDINMRIAFSTPAVMQVRNAHNYLADFQSEEPLYTQSLRLVEQLNEWTSDAETVVERIEQLWVFLHEHGYIGLKDVELVQKWLKNLLAIGYKFPNIIK